MKIKEKIDQISRYCGSYHGHISMIDERNDGSFNIVMPEEVDIKENLNQLRLIILTGEAGDGKSRIIKNLSGILKHQRFKIIEDFSAISQEDIQLVIESIEKILTYQSTERLIIAANVGVFTKSILQYNSNLLNKIISNKNIVKITNFENRNLAYNVELFNNIIDQFLSYDMNKCDNSNCKYCDNCLFQANINALLENRGKESIRVLCDVIYLMGGHITFRELLSLISFAVTFGHDCTSLQQIENMKKLTYVNIFDYPDDILLGKISELDPAKKRTVEDFTEEYDNIEDYIFAKRMRFFEKFDNKYSLLFCDYIDKYKDAIDYTNSPPYFFDVKSDNSVLKDVKEGISKIISQNSTDLGMFISDTPTIVGNEIKTEFEIDLNTIDSIWHNYYFDFKLLSKPFSDNSTNKFCLSFVYKELEEYKNVCLVIDYKLFKYLLMAKDHIFLSKSNVSIEEYTINTFYKKVLQLNPESYKKMKINFNTEKHSEFVNLKLELYKMNHVLFNSKKKIKIKKEN